MWNPLARPTPPRPPRPPLAANGDDRAFAALQADLVAVANRLIGLRGAASAAAGLPRLQFELLLTASDELRHRGRGPTARELAARLDLSVAAVRVTISRLRRDGLAVPPRRRPARLEPTPEGDALIARVRPLLAAGQDHLAAGLTFADFVTLRRLVGRLRADGDRAVAIARRRAGLPPRPAQIRRSKRALPRP